MSYTALARKWRPRTFAELTGQEHVLRALGNALDSGRLHHAFLFAGTRGVGKTTVARILAKCLNCERGTSHQPCGECASCNEIDQGRSVDLIEVDAASRTKVDDTRELLDNVQYAPTRSRFKIYLIDEVHMLSAHSFNALLKTLEEPPPHVKFLLATTDPQKLPVTVLSRCLQFNLKRLPVSLIAARLRHILEAEQLPFEPAALQLLAVAGDGSLRDALSLLDQLLAYGAGKANESEARAMLGTVDNAHAAAVAELLAAGDAVGLFSYADGLEQWSVDYSQLLQQLASLMQAVAIQQVVPDYAAEGEFESAVRARLAAKLTATDVQLYYQTALLGRRDLSLASDPRSGFRMTLVRLLAFRLDERDGARVVPTTTASIPAAPIPAGTAPTEPAAAGGAAPVTSAPTAPALLATPEQWQATVAALEISGATRQLAANCVLLAQRGNLLQLALDARHAVVRTRAQEDKLSQALARHFGQPVRLEFQVQADLGATPARQAELAAVQTVQAARLALEADSTVQALQQRFGATIHPESVRPGSKSNAR